MEAFVEQTENLLRIFDHFTSTRQPQSIYQKLEHLKSLYEERFSNSMSGPPIDIEYKLIACMVKTYMKLSNFPCAVEQYNKLYLLRKSQDTDIWMNIGVVCMYVLYVCIYLY
jgi:hypothetical protein